MRGSVKQRGATWLYVLDAGVDPVTVRRRQVFKRGFRTRKLAQAALNAKLGEYVEDGRGGAPGAWHTRRVSDVVA